MALSREQGEEFVAVVQQIEYLLDEARGDPAVWLRRRGEYVELAARLDELSENIERV